MCIFSVIAAVPTFFARKALLGALAGHGRLIEYGGTVVLTAIIFALCGILLLIITKDPMLAGVKGMIQRKVKH